jgi:riboflavin synthase
MFTGLIESVGRVVRVEPTEAGLRLGLDSEIAAELSIGESVAVNGVCLTVVPGDAAPLEFDVSPETARVTSLGRVRAGGLVNLERPLRADARLGGHFVLGHVDGTGVLESVRTEGEFYWLDLSFPSAIGPYLIPKGSVAVDGISLTVAALDATRFGVQIVPHTWTHTNLHQREVGDVVNLECDVLGKYVLRMMEQAGLARGDLSALADARSEGP